VTSSHPDAGSSASNPDTLRGPQDPGADQDHPGRHDQLGGGAGDERLRESCEGDRCDRGCQPGESGRQGGVPEHLLHVQGADEDEGEEAGPEQEPDGVRPGQGLQPEQAKRQQRRLSPRLDDQIEADPSGATSVPGVWVAGNLANIAAQVITSAAAGLTAAAAINADLADEDAKRAAGAARSTRRLARR
jgi:hypothetical protein